MPTNGEKRPPWLMICKCGAMVKANLDEAENTHFRVSYRPKSASTDAEKSLELQF